MKIILPKTFIIPQTGIIKFNLPLDAKLWILLSNIRFWDSNEKSKIKIIDDKKFVWIKYKTLMELLPILGINNKNSLTKIFKKSQELGLIERYQSIENTLYVHLTDFAKQIYDYEDANDTNPIQQKNDSYTLDERQTCLPKSIQHNKKSNKQTYKYSSKPINNLALHDNKFGTSKLKSKDKQTIIELGLSGKMDIEQDELNKAKYTIVNKEEAEKLLKFIGIKNKRERPKVYETKLDPLDI